MKLPYEPFDLSGITTYPLTSRPSKVEVDDLARPYQKGSGLAGWLASLPAVLAASDFRAVVEAIGAARGRGAPSSGASAPTSSRPASRRSSST